MQRKKAKRFKRKKRMDVTVKNYRCFPDELPVRISLGKGFVALVGVNNAGKSSLLRFFYEFRNLFNQLSDPAMVLNGMRGLSQSFAIPPVITDIAELFHKGNDRSLEILIDVPHAEAQR